MSSSMHTSQGSAGMIIEDKLEKGQVGAPGRCAVLKVGGMFCSNCSNAIERLLNGLEHVDKAEVDLINEKAIVQYRNHAGAPHIFCEEVEDIGFDASVLEDTEISANSALEGARVVINLIDEKASEDSSKFIRGIRGVLDVDTHGTFIKVTYDPVKIGGRTLLKKIQAAHSSVILDPAGEAAGQAGSGHSDGLFAPNLLLALILTASIIIVCWVLPCFDHCAAFLKLEIVPGLKVKAFLMCLLATPVVLVAARKFHVGAYHSVKSGDRKSVV